MHYFYLGVAYRAKQYTGLRGHSVGSNEVYARRFPTTTDSDEAISSWQQSSKWNAFNQSQESRGQRTDAESSKWIPPRTFTKVMPSIHAQIARSSASVQTQAQATSLWSLESLFFGGCSQKPIEGRHGDRKEWVIQLSHQKAKWSSEARALRPFSKARKLSVSSISIHAISPFTDEDETFLKKTSQMVSRLFWAWNVRRLEKVKSCVQRREKSARFLTEKLARLLSLWSGRRRYRRQRFHFSVLRELLLNDVEHRSPSCSAYTWYDESV